jgi:radical SAM protein with 4Fe4S-binding SPASM domain
MNHKYMPFQDELNSINLSEKEVTIQGETWEIVDDNAIEDCDYEYSELVYEDNPVTMNAINRFIEAGCKTNIHYVLSDRSIDEAIWRLNNNDFPEGVNAVIFLLFKPVGCGKSSDTLHWSDPRVERFYSAIENNHLSFKVGLDACNMPGVINFSKNINPVSTSPCDGGSFSAYITSDNVMLPCSFDNVTRNYAFDLSGRTIEEGWKSEKFEAFRNYHRKSCPSCAFQNDCRGGCCLVPEINLCNKKEKQYHED